MRCGVVAVLAAAMLAAAPASAADRQIRPFVGFTFAGDTTFVPNLSDPVGHTHQTIGVDAAWLGDIVGVDVDFAYTPGFFEPDPRGLVIASSLTTATGNVVVGVPRRFAEYVLRPYVVAGGGLMHIHEVDFFDVIPITQTRPTVDFGAGAIGFITKRVGLAWEVRRFQSIGAQEQTGLSFGGEKLSFWRATMAVAFRY